MVALMAYIQGTLLHSIYLATFCLRGDICSKTMTVHFGRIISDILLKNYIQMCT